VLLLTLVFVFVFVLLFTLELVTTGITGAPLVPEPLVLLEEPLPDETFELFPELFVVDTFPPFELAELVFELVLEELAVEEVGVLFIVIVEEPVDEVDPVPIPFILTVPAPEVVVLPKLPPTFKAVAPLFVVATLPGPLNSPSPEVVELVVPELAPRVVDPDPEVAAAPIPPLVTFAKVVPVLASAAVLLLNVPVLPDPVFVAEAAVPLVALAREAPAFVELV